jgi:hypothetical protein
VTTFVEVELQTQTLVRRAEVVEAADQVHTLLEQRAETEALLGLLQEIAARWHTSPDDESRLRLWQAPLC